MKLCCWQEYKGYKMNKKDNIITISEKNESNTYTVDINKPFRVLKDSTFRAFLYEFIYELSGSIFVVLSGLGIITLVLSVIANSTSGMVASAVTILISLVVGVLCFLLARRKRKKHKNLLADVKLLVCTTISQRIEQEEKVYKHYWTVSLEGSNEVIEMWIKNYNLDFNQKIAIATIGDKQIILTKCTLLPIED